MPPNTTRLNAPALLLSKPSTERREERTGPAQLQGQGPGSDTPRPIDAQRPPRACEQQAGGQYAPLHRQTGRNRDPTPTEHRTRFCGVAQGFRCFQERKVDFERLRAPLGAHRRAPRARLPPTRAARAPRACTHARTLPRAARAGPSLGRRAPYTYSPALPVPRAPSAPSGLRAARRITPSLRAPNHSITPRALREAHAARRALCTPR